MKNRFCITKWCKSISDSGRETTRLTIRSSAGTIIHRKEYRTWRGAKIAMGKLGDCWRNELLNR